mgnify:FL=1
MIIDIDTPKQLPKDTTFRLVDELPDTDKVVYALTRLHPKRYTEWFVEVKDD